MNKCRGKYNVVIREANLLINNKFCFCEESAFEVNLVRKHLSVAFGCYIFD